MTPDERIEALLNRAGQTISDLPKATNYDFAYTDHALAIESVHEFECCEDITTLEFADYILHLTDIIDRMENALENVCGERDYLRKVIEKDVPCLICVTTECRADDDPCNSCLLPDGETMVNYEYAGVPENWSVQQ